MGRNSTNLIIYVDPSLSTKNQLLSASSAQELDGFMAGWENDLSTVSELAAFDDILPCCSKPVVWTYSERKQKETRKTRREEGGRGRKGRMKMKSEGRKGNRKQPLKPQLPLDIFRGSFCPYILKILIYGSWLADEKKGADTQKIDPILRNCFSFIICPFSWYKLLLWNECIALIQTFDLWQERSNFRYFVLKRKQCAGLKKKL